MTTTLKARPSIARAAPSKAVPAPPKFCADCSHRQGEHCRHPQSAHLWGRLIGLQNVLPDRGWPRYPTATAACGWWNPTKQWLETQSLKAKP